MIHALLQYAQDRGLASKPGYTKKTVKWVLAFDEAGERFTGLVPSDRLFECAPELGSRVKRLSAYAPIKEIGGANSNFLIESLGKILGRSQRQDDWPKAEREMLTFRWLLDQASRIDPSFGRVANTLGDPKCIEAIHAEVAALRAKWTDKATIRIGNFFPAESTAWHGWWDEFRLLPSDSEAEECSAQMVCFGTGHLVVPVGLHLGISRSLLGDVGASNDAPLITFDKDAFRSYNLDSNNEYGRNAAMSEPTMKAYVEALREILSKSIKLGGTRVGYWYTGPDAARKDVEREYDLIQALLGRRTEEVEESADEREEEADSTLADAQLRKIIKRVREGGQKGQLGQVRFCLLILSADAGARIMVRNFVQGSILELAVAVESWANALDTVGHTGRGKSLAPFGRILLAPLKEELAEDGRPRQRDRKKVFEARKISNAWLQRLWAAATVATRVPPDMPEAVCIGWGLPIPKSAVSRALDLHTRFIQSGKLALALDGNSNLQTNARAEWLSKTRLRLALLKAHLIRKGVTMKPALDPEHPSSAYHCGRLLAAFDSLQREALGDVGAGVIQRYYGGALTNPSGVFGQLSRMAQTHLSKLDGGLFRIYEGRIAEIHNGIRRQGDQPACYPAALNLDDQALFALGFWHQIAKTNQEIADAAAAKKAREQAAKDNTSKKEEN